MASICFLNLPTGLVMILYVLLVSICPEVTSWSYQEEFAFRNIYLKKHNGAIRPLKDLTQSVRVDGDIGINSLGEFDLVKGNIKLDAYLVLSWYDEIIPWNTTNYNITNLTTSKQDVWAPRMGIYNTESIQQEFYQEMVIRRDGYVQYWVPLNSYVFCSVDAYAYPFDRHNCHITIYFDDYVANNVKFRKLNCPLQLQQVGWTIKIVCSIHVHKNYSYGRLGFRLTRKVQINSFSSLLPLFIFLILNIMAGHLPVKSGEKVTFATTVFLSNVVYLGNVAKQLPKEPNKVPLIFLCHLTLTSLSGISAIVSIVASKIYWTRPLNPPTESEGSVQYSEKAADLTKKESKIKGKEISIKKYFCEWNLDTVMFNVMTFISVLYAVTFTTLFSEYILR